MSSTTPDLLPGTLQLLILRTVLSGPMHGYAIAKRIREASSGALVVEEGSLYPALNRMLVKGWISAKWGVSDNNRKARFYEITRAGRRQLAKEEGDFHDMVAAIQLVLSQT
ncbi:MAG TPA: PadR family transcriptional regulator [Bryobacteraceae bacterium]|nr:PadR family transcriptional regulator [Bryobacteraceae bacterium]HPT25395.1 PadR family transcriptional regulator [Bryobacteraceae bacterium]